MKKAAKTSKKAAKTYDIHVILEDMPEDVLATMESRDAQMAGLGAGDALGLEFLIEDLQRWVPGQVIRVAFLDGGTELHRDIMKATREITETCNIGLDFGESPAGFRRWGETDDDYAAEIRVSFDKPGFFSLVGTDSMDPGIGSPQGRVGGRPHQCSLNLGGFAQGRPPTWRGTVLHEFLHALAFHHSHQNMRGPCEGAFRWDDDQGYDPTQNSQGSFVADSAGRRPGIYTYLAGNPNFWNRAKVDHNLRTVEDPGLIAGPFDRRSVMLYRFPSLFYKTLPSPCAPLGTAQKLSEGDRRGLQLLYPATADGSEAVVARQRRMLSTIGADAEEDEGLESTAVPAGAMKRRAAAILRHKLEAPKL